MKSTDIKSKFKLFTRRSLRSLRSLGLDLSKMSECDYDINKAKNISVITKPKEKLEALRKLTKKYPHNPKAFFELARGLHHLCEPSQFEAMAEYGKIREKWMNDTGYNQLDIEFFSSDYIIGSFGNFFAIECLIRANELGLRDKKKIFVLKHKKDKIRNLALWQYFNKYVNLIEVDDYREEENNLESLARIHAGVCIPLKNECIYYDIVANRCEQEILKRKLNHTTFKLNEEHYEKGVNSLKAFGLPKDAWYVTFHVREPGFRGDKENREKSQAFNRNSNPKNYIKAMERITKAGGWVFRMGDPTMTRLPKMNQVIDYAHSPLRSDLLDVFLLATSKFCVGTSSGPMRVAGFFGVPVILSNNILHAPYYSLKTRDLYLPKKIKKITDNKNIKLQEMIKLPLSLYEYGYQYKNLGLYLVENSPEEIDFTVKEMMERFNGSTIDLNNYQLTSEQSKFKKMAEENGVNYAKSVEAFTPCSKYFLTENTDLF